MISSHERRQISKPDKQLMMNSKSTPACIFPSPSTVQYTILSTKAIEINQLYHLIALGTGKVGHMQDSFLEYREMF